MTTGRILDLAGINPTTKKPWGLPRELHVPEWGVRLSLHWDNHQYMEDGTAEGHCLHWTAGNLVTAYSSYPLTAVANDKGEAFLVKMLKWHQKPAHLWGRNGNITGQCLAGNPEVKQWRPYTTQVDLLAKFNAEKCAWHNVDPRGKIKVPELRANANATVITPTGKTIEVPTLWDHKAYAEVDNYGRFRYDARAKARTPAGVLDTQMMFARWVKKTLEHYDALKSGKATFEFEAALKN
jgi:hypothetical protein